MGIIMLRIARLVAPGLFNHVNQPRNRRAQVFFWAGKLCAFSQSGLGCRRNSRLQSSKSARIKLTVPVTFCVERQPTDCFRRLRPGLKHRVLMKYWCIQLQILTRTTNFGVNSGARIWVRIMSSSTLLFHFSKIKNFSQSIDICRERKTKWINSNGW